MGDGAVDDRLGKARGVGDRAVVTGWERQGGVESDSSRTAAVAFGWLPGLGRAVVGSGVAAQC